MNAQQRGWLTRWEKMWERGDERAAGPQGQRYFEKTKGRDVEPEEFTDDYYDEYGDYDDDGEY